MPATFLLYKDPNQNDMLNIIQYLHSNGINMIPKAVFERGYPIQVIKLPAIYDMDDKQLYLGIDECVKYFEKKTKMKKLLDKSKDFKEKNPDYTMN